MGCEGCQDELTRAKVLGGGIGLVVGAALCFLMLRVLAK